MAIAMMILLTIAIIMGNVALAIRDEGFDLRALIPNILLTLALGTFGIVFACYFENNYPAISAVINADSTEVHKVNDKVEYVILKDKAGNTHKLEAAPQN